MTKSQIANITEALGGYGRALGLNGVLPGMRLIKRVVDSMIEQFELEAAAAAGAAESEDYAEQALTVRTPGVRRKYPVRLEGKPSGWPDDPEERSRESLRRRGVALAKKQSKQKASAKTLWANMSKRERAERLQKMQAGKKKAQRAASRAQALPTVRMHLEQSA